ncbi:GNAT family N-acetyltransferase [Bacillus thermotolerans]|uniref:Ribosomal-protein-alanine acetyltransferase n=1 Tax=Bacillus thermotolerans TaxID=1221996 RepID=A0A0F5HM14_BACTR|nr:GNAT family N-acetyltransferase [Bacillus thermotolerans]KKB34331.1 Ribosomal-protein-alanine acetyltransferase [Bacillus thermotolerans]
MVHVTLVPHHPKYAEAMSHLSSAPQVKDALGLSDDQTSVEGTTSFIEFIIEQERAGTQYSRVILNEEKHLVGVITLKDINTDNKTSHIGTWIGYPYWGKGYNQLAKKEILYTAFTQLDLEYVFAGAQVSNIRSQKAQEKLPYIRLNVEKEFPEEHKKIEAQVKAECVLHVIEKEAFLKDYAHTANQSG